MIDNQNQAVIKKDITEADLSNIQALVKLCTQYDGVEMPLDVAKTPGSGLLYYQNGALLGFAYLLGENRVEVLGLVHPQYRCQGIGRRLLDAVRTLCQKQSKEKLQIICFGALPSGKAFVQAMGGAYTLSEYHMALHMEGFEPSALAYEDLRLHQANASEAGEVSRLIVEAFGEAEEEIRPWIEKDIQRPARRFFLIMLHKKPIGTIGVIEVATGKVDITTFGILPHYRGHGYGRQILQYMVAILLAEGWSQIELDVESENANALSLYQACGFQQVSVYEYYRVEL